MNARTWGRWTALLWMAAFAGCSNRSSEADGLADCTIARVCGGPTPAPISEVPPEHRATAQACSPTPASANFKTYDATGQACTKDDDCQVQGQPRGFCLHGACTIDECLTDADCPGQGVCICSSPFPDTGHENLNACVTGNCRVDGDCGAGGYCIPSSGICAIDGFFCHTAADTCVDPTLDCGPSCVQSCSYFRDEKKFACPTPVCAGC